jgi:hypothetical protein
MLIPRAYREMAFSSMLDMSRWYLGIRLGSNSPFRSLGDIYLEFPILAFEGLRGMAIPFVGGDPISLLIFFITEGSVQFRLHEFPRDVFKTFLEKGIDIRDAGNVVF